MVPGLHYAGRPTRAGACGPTLQFGTPAAVAARYMVSHICVPDHAGAGDLHILRAAPLRLRGGGGPAGCVPWATAVDRGQAGRDRETRRV